MWMGILLYGRGVEDDHHGIVASLFAVRAFMEAGITPARTIGLALVSDEETGSQKGLADLLAHHRELFSPEDLIIVPDAGNAEGTLIEIAEKSMLWLRLEIQGKQCHASKPGLGINTLTATAHFIVALEALAQEFSAVDPFFDPPHSTFEPTKKEANVQNINTIPGLGVFYLDCRVLPEYDLGLVIAKVKEIGGEIERRFGRDHSRDLGPGGPKPARHAGGRPCGQGSNPGRPGGVSAPGRTPGYRRRHRGGLFPAPGSARGGLDDR